MPADSTVPRRCRKARGRPPKPRKDFPLYPHPAGYWAKKIRGKFHYFGRWGRVNDGRMVRIDGDGWREAEQLYDKEKADLYAGRSPRRVKIKLGEPTIADLCNAFRTAKLRSMEAGEIGGRMYDEYVAITDLLVEQFGRDRFINELMPADFERLRAHMSRRWGPTRLANQVTRVKSVFRYAYQRELIDHPFRCLEPNSSIFGPPSKSVLRVHRAKRGKLMLEADECRKLISAAPTQLRAMLYLGLNGAFGNHDVATLPMSAIDLDRGWIDYARPKTGVARRCPLWPETVAALKAAIAERQHPKNEESIHLVFVTSRGRPWLSRGIANPVSVAARKLMKDCGIHGRRGIGFYTLRHIFRTIADATKDFPAVRLIMGHTDPSIDATYREQIDDDRLQAVVEHMRRWLFAKEKAKPK